MSIVIGILLGVWGIIALLMMLVILMQRPKSEGLGAAFGGAVTENLFGAQTTNVLVKFTAWLAGIFFFITFLLSVLYAHRSMGGSSLTRELKKTATATAPAASPGASPATAAAAQSSPGQSPQAATPPGVPAAGVVPTGNAPATSPPQSAPAASPAAAQQQGSASQGAPQPTP
jgi:preprotein translocase subunit SecG